MHQQRRTASYRQERQTSIPHRQRQLPPLHDIIKPEIDSKKPKFEEDWGSQTTYADLSSTSTIPTATSATQSLSTGTSMPGLTQSFEDLKFGYTDDMLSSPNLWGTPSQYSTPTYPTSTPSSQAYYSRPSMNTGRTQQNLPSLTEMNLASTTPAYSIPRASHMSTRTAQSDMYYSTGSTDPLNITYSKNTPCTYNSSLGLMTPRTTPYSVSSNTYGGDYSPIDQYCGYTNGHSWPPGLCNSTHTSYLNSDAQSLNGGRKRRGNLPKNVTDMLRAWFHEHLDHPYPTDEDKQMLMSRTNLSMSQISNWFINARRRHWPQLKAQRDQLHRAPINSRSGGGT